MARTIRDAGGHGSAAVAVAKRDGKVAPLAFVIKATIYQLARIFFL